MYGIWQFESNKQLNTSEILETSKIAETPEIAETSKIPETTEIAETSENPEILTILVNLGYLASLEFRD